MSYNQSKVSQQPSISPSLKFSSLRRQDQEAHRSSQETTSETLRNQNPTYSQQQSLQIWTDETQYPQQLTYQTLEGTSQYNLLQPPLSESDNQPHHYSEEDST